MKKLLLACFLALGLGATAQITVNETFEASPVPNFTISGGYQPNRYTDGGCGGDNGGYGSNIYDTAAPNNTVNIIYTKPTGVTANGKKIDISFDYSTYALEGVGGSLNVAYMKANTGSVWTTVGTVTIPTTNPDLECRSFTGTIPETSAVNGAFRLRIQGTSTNGNDFYFFVDNVKIIQETVTAPACTTVTVPANGVNPNNSTPITWTSAAGATNYKVYVGTSAGASDIVNGTSVSSTSYLLSGLQPNTNYFVRVVPTNANGDASGCTETSFTTGAATYCSDATATASDHENFEKISNVTFAGIDNNSTSTVGYEDFTAVVGTVMKGATYPISVTISDYDSDLTSVWIDYNHDLVFSASEKVDLTETEIATGTVQIPANAVAGDTRMRVRTSFQAAPAPCGSSAYGQTEDYTITITENPLAVSGAERTKISVYPNPFVDVLKISEVKDLKSITVSDVSGRQVKTLAPAAEINLSDLKSGLYIVSLKMVDGSVKTFKTVKK